MLSTNLKILCGANKYSIISDNDTFCSLLPIVNLP